MPAEARSPAIEPEADGVSQPSAQVESATVPSRRQNSRTMAAGQEVVAIGARRLRSRATMRCTSIALANSPACPATPPMA